LFQVLIDKFNQKLNFQCWLF